MMPDEAQVIIAKILFFVFAVSLLCVGRAHSAEVDIKSPISTEITISLN